MHMQFRAWLAVLLLASAAAAQQVYVDNVVVILDASGSMNKHMSGTRTPKIEAAKSAIAEVLKTIPASTQVGLLVFGGRHNGWVYPLGVRDDGALLEALATVYASGGTPLGAFMKTGADRLLEARKAQYGYGSYRLLVVTDGEASDAQLVEAYTPDVISRGIVADVIGVDMAKDHTLATRVHSYRRANDPEALRKAVREVFAEVGKSSEDPSGEGAFQELAGFPPEAAMAVIAALMSSGDQPIGETRSASAPTEPSARGVTPPRPDAPSGSRSGRRGGRAWILPAMVVVFLVLRFMKRGRRR